jgi:hypothetical protein
MQPVVRLDIGRGRRPVTVTPVLPSVHYEIHTLIWLCHSHAAKVIYHTLVSHGFYKLWLKNICGFTFVSCCSTCRIWFRVLAVFVCVSTENIDGFRTGNITFGGRRGYRIVIASGTCSVESSLPLGCVSLCHLSAFLCYLIFSARVTSAYRNIGSLLTQICGITSRKT